MRFLQGWKLAAVVAVALSMGACAKNNVGADGAMIRGTMWRVVAVTVHVPSLQSAEPLDGTPLRVRTVEVSVLPDVSLLPALELAAEEVLSESRL